MKLTLNSLILSSMLVASAGYADGFGFDLGPFSLQFNAGDFTNRNNLEGPICKAIANQNQVEITVKSVVATANEKKITIKKLIVEPYLLGVTKEGKPVLRGRIVDEVMVKEVVIKTGNEDAKNVEVKEDGFFSGIFSSDKSKNIDISNIRDIRIVDGSHFDVPKGFKAVADTDDLHVKCQIAVPLEK